MCLKIYEPTQYNSNYQNKRSPKLKKIFINLSEKKLLKKFLIFLYNKNQIYLDYIILKIKYTFFC